MTPGYEHIAFTHDITHPDYLAHVQKAAAQARALQPWTLVAMPRQLGLVVAKRRTLLWRLVTAWLNIWRRRERKRQQRAIAFHFSPGQVQARVNATRID